ncbi:MAG TPA: hypothetical protein VKS01_04740, partial [Bryobacteraceae bacterium]|nr:hypothetical protein [Bryobacteraceae bacterium]
MLQTLQEQPNYTCTETVERFFRVNPARKFQLHDTLRLEVALVAGQEMYAFPGARRFEAVSLEDMIGDTGAISNGDFALHARAIFGSQGPVFTYRGEGSDGDRPWVRFDYDVALKVSGFQLKHGSQKAITAYHGSFDADPRTLDIERIVLIADQIPAVIGFKKTIKNLSFARIKIGEGTFLLPSESDMTIVENDNAENLNESKFSSCRQFTGESVLTFDEPSGAATSVPARIEEVKLPAEISLPLVLDQAIEARRAAIGDPVTAHIFADVKVKSRLVVPKGAIVHGRVTRAEQHHDYVLLGIELMEMEWKGAHAVLHADLNRAVDNLTARQTRRTIDPIREHEGLLMIGLQQSSDLPRGLLMYWTTTP